MRRINPVPWGARSRVVLWVSLPPALAIRLDRYRQSLRHRPSQAEIIRDALQEFLEQVMPERP